MSRGILETPPVQLEKCGTKCPVCTGAWHKIFLAVNKAKLVNFLECEPFQKQMGMLVAKGDNIVDILWSVEKWRIEEIFGCKVKKSKIDALFLQLIATSILELKHTTNGLVWSYGRTSDPSTSDVRQTILNYKQDRHWVGIRLK